jgi:hypothetical protein
MTKFARGRFTNKMSIHTQGITYGRKYRNHLHIRIIQAYEGLKLRPDLIIYTFLYAFLHNKKPPKGILPPDGWVTRKQTL